MQRPLAQGYWFGGHVRAARKQGFYTRLVIYSCNASSILQSLITVTEDILKELKNEHHILLLLLKVTLK